MQPPVPWMVDRPAEVSQVIAALGNPGGETVGITTAVQGVGGFGKTTVAKMVSRDPRVLRRYRGRVYWVTLGRYARRETLPGLVNGLIAQLEPDRAVTFTDTRQAADHLAEILAAGPRRLLILDDVWTGQQLTAFPSAGRCARLVTTRIPALTAAGMAIPVPVDQMTDGQARAVLLHGLPPLPPAVVGGLLAETGRWPLLLRLVNKILAMLRTDITVAAEELLGRLRAGRALEVDEVTGAADRRLDVADPDQRNQTVRATIQASAGLLSRAEQNLLAELAVFAEDETIPVGLIALLWQATSGLDHLAAGALVTRLSDLALLTPAPGGTVTMHDVLRDHFRDRLGAARLAQLHDILLDRVADGLPVVLAASGRGGVTAWWELPGHSRYLRSHLLEHMLAADRPDLEAVATDLRWAASRLGQDGPAAVYADLTLAGSPRAYRLRRLLGQNAHLLAPTDPPYSLASILYSRVSHDPDWAPQATSLAASPGRPALANAWPLPDLPPPALRLILTGHDGPVRGVAAAPDGSWLGTAGDDGTVRIWDAATGQHRATLTGHDGLVHAVAAAPDGSWLATASDDGTARIWDATTGQHRATLTGHPGSVYAVAIAPDGSWLATASDDGTARIWDAATGQHRATLTGHPGSVYAVAIAPDGSWLATAGYGGTVRTWDAATGQHRATLTGHPGSVYAVAIAPDGSWLATAGYGGTVRTWDAATGQQRAALTGHHFRVRAVAVAPDGTWLATAGDDGTARIWDATTGQQRATLIGHVGSVYAVALAPDGSWLVITGDDGTARIWDAATGQVDPLAAGRIPIVSVAFAPDSTWLATVSGDGTARIWDAATGGQRATLTDVMGSMTSVAVAPDGTWLATASGPRGIALWDATTGQRSNTFGRLRLGRGYERVTSAAVVVAPDGSWLATASDDGTARIWDATTGQQRASLTGHESRVRAVAVAPDGSWLATVSDDGTARTWDAATGQHRATLTGHTGPVCSLAVAPDGSWLATAGDDGTARIWDATTGQQRASLTGHESRVRAVAAAPDGAWLATANADRTVRIWDASTGASAAVMRVDSPVSACTWSPSGHLLAVAGEAGLYLFAFSS